MGILMNKQICKCGHGSHLLCTEYSGDFVLHFFKVRGTRDVGYGNHHILCFPSYNLIVPLL